MVRLTAYTKKMAARGNARTIQATLAAAPTAPVLGAERDHAHRTRSSRELRALPALVCRGCLDGQPAEHRGVFTICRNLACADNARGCEGCGTPIPVEVGPLTRDQSWRRYGK